MVNRQRQSRHSINKQSGSAKESRH